MKLATFGVKWASDDSFCPSTVEKKKKIPAIRKNVSASQNIAARRCGRSGEIR